MKLLVEIVRFAFMRGNGCSGVAAELHSIFIGKPMQDRATLGRKIKSTCLIDGVCTDDDDSLVSVCCRLQSCVEQ